MGLGWGKLYVTIERRPCFFAVKIASQLSAIFTARRKNSHCVKKSGSSILVKLRGDLFEVFNII